MPIRFTTDDPRSPEQTKADDQVRHDVEQTGGIWAQMTQDQRDAILARLRAKKARAEAARAQKQVEADTLEQRVAKLEARLARLGG